MKENMILLSKQKGFFPCITPCSSTYCTNLYIIYFTHILMIELAVDSFVCWQHFLDDCIFQDKIGSVCPVNT